jgi:GLPGLI family protein
MRTKILLAASFFAIVAQAQTKEGRVVYERVMQMPAPPGDMPAEIRQQLPKSRTAQYELLFTPEHSLWQYLPNAAAEEQSTFSSGGMVIRLAGAGNEVTYVNFAQATRTDQREMFEKNFVVTDTVAKVQWKLSDETKPILNFTARKATGTSIVTRARMTMENGEMKREIISDTVPVVAWYTPEVPVPAGPDFQGQLPGLILELDVNNGRNLTKAIEFSPRVASAKIKAPADGKKLTAAEFAKEREKMMEEMRKNMPNGNVIRMN